MNTTDPKELLSILETQMQKAVAHFGEKLAAVRTSRVSASMLNRIRVHAYGDMVKLEQVGTVSVLDGQTLLIKPWDKSLMRHIEAAVSKADLGFAISSDVEGVILKMLPITEESRKKAVNHVKVETENAKITVRKLRHDAKDQLRRLANEDIDEDELKRLDVQIQKETDSHIAELEKLSEHKRNELLKI